MLCFLVVLLAARVIFSLPADEYDARENMADVPAQSNVQIGATPLHQTGDREANMTEGTNNANSSRRGKGADRQHEGKPSSSQDITKSVSNSNSTSESEEIRGYDSTTSHDRIVARDFEISSHKKGRENDYEHQNSFARHDNTDNTSCATDGNASCSTKTDSTSWENGYPHTGQWPVFLVSDLQRIKIVKILRAFSLVAVVCSLACAVISAVVFSHKNFSNTCQQEVITFNVLEALKTFWFLFQRIWKYAETDQITWASPYAVFFRVFMCWCTAIFGRSSVTLNGVMAVERFFILAFPFKHVSRKPCAHPWRPIIAIVLIISACQSVMLFTVWFVVHPAANVTQKFTHDDLIPVMKIWSPLGERIYLIHTSVTVAIFRYVPILVAITFNVMTMVAILYHRKVQKQMNSTTTANQRKRRQIHVVIVVSSLIFALLVFQKPLVRNIGLAHPTFGPTDAYANIYRVIKEISILLDVLSPFINIVAYFKLSSVFRQVLVQTLRGRQQGHTQSE